MMRMRRGMACSFQRPDTRNRSCASRAIYRSHARFPRHSSALRAAVVHSRSISSTTVDQGHCGAAPRRPSVRSERGCIHMAQNVTIHDDRADPRRERAIKRLKKRRDFYTHLVVFTLVNGFLIAIWAVTGAGFFWPVFPMVAWGIGLSMNAWDAFRDEDFDEEHIQREIRRIQHHR